MLGDETLTVAKSRCAAHVPKHLGEICRSVGAVLVCPEIQADHGIFWPLRKPGTDGLHPFVVETEPVNRRLVLGQTEQARLRVARLRARRGGTHFDETKAGLGQGRQRFGILVEPGGQTNRVGQVQTGNLRT